MIYPLNDLILNDFELSIIIPAGRDIATLKKTLEQNSGYFQRNGIEVIIISSERTCEGELIDIIKNFPFINWKLLYHSGQDDPVNSASMVNAGIKAAAFEYVMFCDPNWIFISDVIFRLSYVSRHYHSAFVTGSVWSSSDGSCFHSSYIHEPLLIKKKSLDIAGGCSEFFETVTLWTEHLYSKLERNGLRKLKLEDAVVKCKKVYLSQSEPMPVSTGSIRRSRYPFPKDFNYPAGNLSFDLIFDYSNNPFARQSCLDYLNQFPEYQICETNTFRHRFPLVVLMHTHNEIKYIPDTLLHLDKICDGIILLDDGSTDKTYEAAGSEKLLIKIKAEKKEFNELRNKNILLNIASFIQADWFLIVDADERIETFGRPILDLIRSPQKAFCLYLVHLWDSPHAYRTDVPETSPIGVPGILHRWRLFKSIGRTQIISHRKFHFKHTPFQSLRKVTLPLVILHYGMMERTVRAFKYQHYLEVDQSDQHHLYAYFNDREVNLKKVENLSNVISTRLPLQSHQEH